jgi:hypothetical protein
MSQLQPNAAAALAALASPSPSPQTLVASDGRRKIVCQLATLDSLACRCDELALETDELAAASVDRLKEISQNLAGRLTYLLEAISPIEIDPERCVVQMRSSPPQKNDDGTTYYELLVERGGRLALSRHQKQPGAVRQTISAELTREVLLRLIGDFDAALD